MSEHIAFIGGGNMANAIIGGLLRQGFTARQISVIEPFQETREKLSEQYGLKARESADDSLSKADLVVWAVKPQTFREATLSVREFTRRALHLSVAAGIRSDSIAAWLGCERIVRAMPNTPALIGQGITGLYARQEASSDDRAFAEKVVRSMGEFLWLEAEQQLDTVTALSGSGPAYVFFFMEAMTQAGVKMGLSQKQALHLAIATFAGSSSLAKGSGDAPDVLRQRVTSKGGTTYAAITSMEKSEVQQHFINAMLAAQSRAKEMGDEFGSA